MTTKGKVFTRVAGAAVALSLGFATGPAAHAQWGPPPPPPPARFVGGWDAPPPEMREAERQGFRDGIVGAQRDVENHRRPNVWNRDEFRHPNVPGFLAGDYQDGFRRGYDRAMSHILGGPRPY